MKIKAVKRTNGIIAYIFYCPGCKIHHLYDVRIDGGHPSWVFNGNMESPTFTPSLLYPDLRCHLYVINGKIRYEPDCSHELAGRTIDMVDLDDISGS
jgi:hypothetical protein